jgi:hypothetical protein
MNLFDMIAEDEAKAVAATRAEMAAEKAAYDALPQEEKDRRTAEVEAKWGDTPHFDIEADEEEEDEDGDDD